MVEPLISDLPGSTFIIRQRARVTRYQECRSTVAPSSRIHAELQRSGQRHLSLCFTSGPIDTSTEYQSIAAGDRTAFEGAFRAFYPELCGFASSYVKDADQAEDIVQDLFVRLWNDRGKVEIRTSLRSYMYTAVRNRCLNMIKVNKRLHSLNGSEEHATDHTEVDEIEHAERIQRVHAAIARLPEARQNIFKLSRYEGLKYHEIADRLGISIKTVENQMGSALKTLRAELADLLPSATVAWLVWLFGNG